MSTKLRSLHAPARTARLTILLAVAFIFVALAVGGSGLFRTASAAGPWYVDPTGNDASSCLGAGSACKTIQAAIGKASAGDTINVAAGTYVEDLTIAKSVDLVGAGSGTTTIKGIATVPAASFPLAAPNIDVQADSVSIHGFTIQGPDVAAGFYSSGMVIGGSSVDIYDNAFEVTNAASTNDISQGIQTYHKTIIPGVDVSGLNVHNNTFTHHGAGAAGYEAIYVNPDAGTGNIFIANNQFSGNLLRAITTERSNTTINSNSVVTTLAPGLPGGYIGILVRDSLAAVQSSVTVSNNAVGGSGGGTGFAVGIQIGKSGQTLTSINITGNVVHDSIIGIKVVSSPSGVTLTRNEIAGNTTGVSNEAAGSLDATCNWWGAADGPGGVGSGSGDPVSANVTFQPWLLNSNLATAPCGGPATTYLVTAATVSPVAGATDTITAQLADASGNAVATAGLVVTWTKSDPNGSFASPTSTTDASGIATVVFTTHTVAGTSTTVTATDTGPLAGTSATITTVAPATAPPTEPSGPSLAGAGFDVDTHLFCFVYDGPTTTASSGFASLFATGINAVNVLQFPAGNWLSWFRGFTLAQDFSISTNAVICVSGTGTTVFAP